MRNKAKRDYLDTNEEDIKHLFHLNCRDGNEFIIFTIINIMTWINGNLSSRKALDPINCPVGLPNNHSYLVTKTNQVEFNKCLFRHKVLGLPDFVRSLLINLFSPQFDLCKTNSVRIEYQIDKLITLDKYVLLPSSESLLKQSSKEHLINKANFIISSPSFQSLTRRSSFFFCPHFTYI